MTRKLLLVALVLGVMPLAAQRTAPTVGDVAPIVTVSDLAGHPVRLAVAPGKQGMVIEFWATWCEICAALMPNVRAAATKYGDKVDFIGVNVTVNDSRSRVERYVARNTPPFHTVYDTAGVSQRAFGASTTSYVVIIDAKGRIRYTGTGEKQDLVAELGKVVGR